MNVSLTHDFKVHIRMILDRKDDYQCNAHAQKQTNKNKQTRRADSSIQGGM